MKTKICTKCSKRKRISLFYRNKLSADDLSSTCKRCSLARTKVWKKANPDKVRQHARDWAIRNPEKNREKSRIWARKNLNRSRKKARDWSIANPERVKKNYKKWKKSNPDRLKLIQARYEAKNPEAARERVRKRRALKKSSLGWLPPFPEGILFGQQAGLCLYCNADLEQSGWHMEHKIPLSRGGEHDWENVCLSCPSCNLTKNTKTSEEFMA